MRPPVSIPYALATLAVAVLFGAIFLIGGRGPFRPGQHGYRRFLSFAAGISVGYTFVHVLPALSRIPELAAAAAGVPRTAFPEYSVYLWTMAGFLIFYGLETLVAGPPPEPPGSAAAATSWQPWVHIGGFALYAWLLTYLLVWAAKGTLALCLYAAAMGLHLFPIAGSLSGHYPTAYRRRGAPLLALACLTGWACGLAGSIPLPALGILIALVAGGVIVNAMIAELPKENEGRYAFFLTGAAAYTALLLTLSHFEEVG